MKTTRPIPTTFALLVATLLSSMDVTVVGTALPRIVGQLGGLELYPWVFSIYLLTSTVTVPVWGKLCDLFGRRPTFLGGIGLFLVGSAACGAAPSMGWLVAARALQGLGAGAIFPVSQTIFGDIFTLEKRARMQGIFSLVWGVSSILGPAVGGLIVSLVSWRWVFYVNLPVGVVAIALFVGAFHERIERHDHALDLAGAALLCGGITLLLRAMPGQGTARPLALLVLATLCLAAFIAVERRAKEPLVPLELFRDPVIAVAGAAGLLTGGVLYVFIAYMPLFLQGVLGYSPMIAGLLTAPMSLAWTTATFAGGRWILRSGFRIVLRVSMLLAALGLTAIWRALARLPTPSGWVLFTLGNLVLGAGLGMGLSAFIIAVQDRVGWQRRGVATAILTLLRSLGATVGVAGLGAVLTSLLGRALADLGGSLSPSALLDPRRYAAIAPSVLGPARAALGAAITTVFGLAIILSMLALGLTLRFPDVRAAARRPDAPKKEHA